MAGSTGQRPSDTEASEERVINGMKVVLSHHFRGTLAVEQHG